MIPIPEHLAHLPVWHGLPIPTIASWSSEYPEQEWRWRYDHHVQRQAWFSIGEAGVGTPVLGRMNPQRQRRSASTLRCQVCDAALEAGRAWLAVGPGTRETVTVEGRVGTANVVYEPWLCAPCARYAVAVCPGLVGRRRTESLVLHRPRTHLLIMSTAYMDGPLAEEAKKVLPALWVKIAVSDGLTLQPNEFLGVDLEVLL